MQLPSWLATINSPLSDSVIMYESPEEAHYSDTRFFKGKLFVSERPLREIQNQ